MGTRLPFTVSDLIAMDVFPPPLAADAWTRTYGPRLHETHTGRTGRSPEITCKSSSLGQVRGRPKAGQTMLRCGTVGETAQARRYAAAGVPRIGVPQRSRQPLPQARSAARRSGRAGSTGSRKRRHSPAVQTGRLWRVRRSRSYLSAGE